MRLTRPLGVEVLEDLASYISQTWTKNAQLKFLLPIGRIFAASRIHDVMHTIRIQVHVPTMNAAMGLLPDT